VFWVISVYFNIRNTLPKFCPFLPGHSVYITILNYITNAPTYFGASAPSAGRFDIAFAKVIKYLNYLNYIKQ